MHGTVRMDVILEGETIRDMDIDIGYLHRGFEIQSENATWTQVLPYTDRLDYVAALANNFGYLTAVETLMGIDIPERAKYIRVIGAELHRVSSHLTTAGALALELGGFSAFLYAMEARELITDRITELTGARLTTSYGRIGGLASDLPEGWLVRLEEIFKQYEFVPEKKEEDDEDVEQVEVQEEEEEEEEEDDDFEEEGVKQQDFVEEKEEEMEDEVEEVGVEDEEGVKAETAVPQWGSIVSYSSVRKWGFISSDTGDVFFRAADWISRRSIYTNQRVRYTLGRDVQNLVCARYVKALTRWELGLD